MFTSSLDAKLLGVDELPAGTDTGLLGAMQADKELTKAMVETVIPDLQKRVLEDQFITWTRPRRSA